LRKNILILICLVLLLPRTMQSQYAPVTTAGRIINATPGNPSVPVPITVTGFTDIGQLTLTLTFDTTKVHYGSATLNPLLTGMTVTYYHPSDNTLGKLVFNWTGDDNVSLTDESSIATLTFAYISGTGLLVWDYSYGSVCQYKRYVGGVLTLLDDNPQYLFYLNGGISNRSAPVTYAPVFSNPVPGPLSIPVTVTGFTNIGALTLWLEYDPAVITYQNSFTKNPAFGSNFVVGDNPGFGTKRLIVIQWYGGSVNLANGSVLCTLNFSYPAANCNPCALSWFDSGPSCEYADGGGNVLIDMPQSLYYINGNVAEGLLNTWTGTVSSAWDNASNWNSCGIPTIAKNVVIPDVSPSYFPIITVAASCKTLKIQSGATVTVGPTGSLTLQGF
jgi:hypothetical protein